MGKALWVSSIHYFTYVARILFIFPLRLFTSAILDFLPDMFYIKSSYS